jgi:hypothetical protein
VQEKNMADNNDGNITPALKAFEEELIGSHNFYSQTVLKSYAAIAAREKLAESKQPA